MRSRFIARTIAGYCRRCWSRLRIAARSRRPSMTPGSARHECRPCVRRRWSWQPGWACRWRTTPMPEPGGPWTAARRCMRCSRATGLGRPAGCSGDGHAEPAQSCMAASERIAGQSSWRTPCLCPKGATGVGLCRAGKSRGSSSSRTRPTTSCVCVAARTASCGCRVAASRSWTSSSRPGSI